MVLQRVLKRSNIFAGSILPTWLDGTVDIKFGGCGGHWSTGFFPIQESRYRFFHPNLVALGGLGRQDKST